MAAAGAFVLSARLSAGSEAKVVRPSGTRRRVTDGPFVETKEMLGGFYLIEVRPLVGSRR